MIYRRSNVSLIWHTCTNCSNWPKADYVERRTAPQSKLCNECDAKMAYGLGRLLEDEAAAVAPAGTASRTRRK